ncbi:MAG: fibronectin/fibrinogen-binding protein [Peptococcaceae bacterium]|nr:fibronectin/fibrinogen-binding protein [Peptococcaceae bacterium]
MPFDGFVLAAVKKELFQKLIGFRIDKIQQPSKEEIYLVLSKSGSKCRLLLSADSGIARVHLTSQSPENPATPPVFCMVMRKHLEGGRIIGFNQTGYDRVLTISVDTRDDLGRSSEKHIICEIMGKHSNIILCDPKKNIILDGIKRYTHAQSRHREVLPGLEYIPAPGQDKLDPLDINEDDFFQLIMNSNLGNRASEAIQHSFDGLSPLMSREIIWRSGLDTNVKLDILGHVDLSGIFRNLQDLYRKGKEGSFQPTIIYVDNTPKDFAAFPIGHLEGNYYSENEMNSLLETFFTQRNLNTKLTNARQTVINIIKKETGRLEKKLSAQLEDLASASNAEEYRLHGELIKSSIHQLNKGDDHVLLSNYYSEGSPQIIIQLDPNLTPAENAQKLFRKYSKAKKIIANATAHSQATKEELSYLAGVENSTEMAEDLEVINQIKMELVQQGYLKLKDSKQVKQNKKEKPSPGIYISEDGLIILAGKNNQQNDYLTMKMAKPDDIWLHTREIPGSHIVIRTEGKDVPENTLNQAAILAAFFSKAKNSTKVPVDYTYRKFVNKPKGAKPGYVIYSGFKTIIVNPDPELAKKLNQKR